MALPQVETNDILLVVEFNYNNIVGIYSRFSDTNNGNQCIISGGLSECMILITFELVILHHGVLSLKINIFNTFFGSHNRPSILISYLITPTIPLNCDCTFINSNNKHNSNAPAIQVAENGVILHETNKALESPRQLMIHYCKFVNSYNNFGIADLSSGHRHRSVTLKAWC